MLLSGNHIEDELLPGKANYTLAESLPQDRTTQDPGSHHTSTPHW